MGGFPGQASSVYKGLTDYRYLIYSVSIRNCKIKYESGDFVTHKSISYAEPSYTPMMVAESTGNYETKK